MNTQLLEVDRRFESHQSSFRRVATSLKCSDYPPPVSSATPHPAVGSFGTGLRPHDVTVDVQQTRPAGGTEENGDFTCADGGVTADADARGKPRLVGDDTVDRRKHIGGELRFDGGSVHAPQNNRHVFREAIGLKANIVSAAMSRDCVVARWPEGLTEICG
jgi:hypothetical protein